MTRRTILLALLIGALIGAMATIPELSKLWGLVLVAGTFAIMVS